MYITRTSFSNLKVILLGLALFFGSTIQLFAQNGDPTKEQTLEYINNLLKKIPKHIDVNLGGITKMYVEPILKEDSNALGLFTIKYSNYGNNEGLLPCKRDYQYFTSFIFNPSLASNVKLSTSTSEGGGAIVGILYLEYIRPLVQQIDSGNYYKCPSNVSTVPFLFRADIPGEGERLQKALLHLIEISKNMTVDDLFGN
jgi:hypothetical protein